MPVRTKDPSLGEGSGTGVSNMNTSEAVRTIARQMARVRKDKISCIKDKLKAGTYNISSNQVAKALLLKQS